MRKILGGLLFGLCLAGTGNAWAGEAELSESAIGRHMAAQATLAAYYVDAALRAGMSADAINAVLSKIADQTVIGEFWISDETGRIAFSSAPPQGFSFPTDPESDAQAAPFARLLSGQADVVEQEVRPRDLDGTRYKYVGVAGVDTRRIVQVGLPASAVE
ncbi:MAG: hypothetical protein OXI37_00375 [Gammaproteobacteria bacterium]|nr:hypothetical protein [Gammaproteobacteria bacterium]